MIFDADGGNAVITVATNADGWDYAAEGDWFTVARQDGNALLVETLINAGAETLTGKLTVSAEKNGETVSQEVALVQRAERSVNLSAEGTANCYIARTGGVYKFDASVKGNGGGDGVSDYIANYGLAIEDGAFAELLWESRHDGDKTMSREIIDGAPIYRGGYVTFSTGRSEGNAVIAVKDIKGNIVWSWHIWVCNDEITAHDHIDSEGKVAAVIMDRNLGALNNTPMDVGNRGMFYEWGRKDLLRKGIPMPIRRTTAKIVKSILLTSHFLVFHNPNGEPDRHSVHDNDEYKHKADQQYRGTYNRSHNGIVCGCRIFFSNFHFALRK